MPEPTDGEIIADIKRVAHSLGIAPGQPFSVSQYLQSDAKYTRDQLYEGVRTWGALRTKAGFTTETVISSPVPVKKTRRVLLIIIGTVVGGLAVLFLGAILLFRSTITEITEETPKVQTALGAFMNAMAQQDAATAYTYFSARSKRTSSLADIQNLLEDNNYVLFDGYQRVEATILSLTRRFGSDPDSPQGTVAVVQGTVSYSDGFTGTIDAVLEQEGEDWRLFRITIRVPPARFAR